MNKKFIFGLCAFIIFTFIATGGFVRIVNATPSENAVAFDTLKQTILNTVDMALTRIHSAESQIQDNPQLSETTKQTILNSFMQTENALLAYKTQIQNANSLADLQNINRKIAQYLIDNKDTIKTNMQNAMIDLGNQAAAKAEELQQKTEAALKILKIACPQQKNTVTDLENQSAQLNSEITELKQAIAGKDAAAIKIEIKLINQISQNIISDLTIIESECL